MPKNYIFGILYQKKIINRNFDTVKLALIYEDFETTCWKNGSR